MEQYYSNDQSNSLITKLLLGNSIKKIIQNENNGGRTYIFEKELSLYRLKRLPELTRKETITEFSSLDYEAYNVPDSNDVFMFPDFNKISDGWKIYKKHFSISNVSKILILICTAWYIFSVCGYLLINKISFTALDDIVNSINKSALLVHILWAFFVLLVPFLVLVWVNEFIWSLLRKHIKTRNALFIYLSLLISSLMVIAYGYMNNYEHIEAIKLLLITCFIVNIFFSLSKAIDEIFANIFVMYTILQMYAVFFICINFVVGKISINFYGNTVYELIYMVALSFVLPLTFIIYVLEGLGSKRKMFKIISMIIYMLLIMLLYCGGINIIEKINLINVMHLGAYSESIEIDNKLLPFVPLLHKYHFKMNKKNHELTNPWIVLRTPSRLVIRPDAKSEACLSFNTTGVHYKLINECGSAKDTLVDRLLGLT